MEIKTVPIESLHPYEGNVKRHPQSQIDSIKKSIQEFGFNDPIAIDSKGIIIEGHGRYEALKQLGWKEIPVIDLGDMDEEKRKAYTLVHNKLTMQTGFDVKKLKLELQKMPTFNSNLFGFDNKFLQQIDYKQKTNGLTSNILNLGYAQFEGVGRWDIPQIKGLKKIPDCEEWVGFNYVMTEQNPANKGVHFFVDDYQFERVWNRPDEYISKLKKFKCVLSPDFSPYGNMPLITQIWNHYRKHWVGAYWESKGIKVIPTIRASMDVRSLAFYLDGEPQGSAVAYSTMWSRDETMQDAFIMEWQTMIDGLRPTEVLVYGEILPIMKESGIKLVQIPKFTDKRWNVAQKATK